MIRKPNLALVVAMALSSTSLASADDHNEAIDIAYAFADLGMSKDRATCYGFTIARDLDTNLAGQAAKLVVEADSSSEVKRSVILSDPRIVGAFAKADVVCPEGFSR